MWNYRIVKVAKGQFEIREVYYNPDGSIFATTMRPSAPTGETRKELKRDLKAMMNALDKPVLKDWKIEFVPHHSELKTRKEKKHGR